MTQTKINTTGKGMMSVTLTGVTSTEGGGIAAIKNPEGATLLITRSILHVETPSTGAANLSAGIAADASSSATDLINALAINGSITGKWYNGQAAVTSAKAEMSKVWESDEYLTVTGSASSAGFTGTLYIEYIRE